MDPIYLYQIEHENNFAISIGKSDVLLKTPGGNIFSSFNEEIIENTIYELQRYDRIEIDENDSITGEPLGDIRFYSLFSTELDFWSEERLLEAKQIEDALSSDPITNISPGPEAVDQYHQWRSILKILEDQNINFSAIQYYVKDKKEIQKILNKICEDFNSGSNAHKSVFINLLNMYESLIASWAFTYQGQSASAFATAFTQTGIFQMVLQELVNDEIENLKPEDYEDDELFEVDEKDYDRISNQKKKEFFEEFLTVLDSCQKFIDISVKPPLELTLEESLTHEYKSSFRMPYPENPKPLVDDNDQTYYNLDTKKFKSLKEVYKYIERQSLKTIVGFLNTKGGTLVIGVNEKDNIKKVVGIERDNYKSSEQYERHLIQQISNRIGTKFASDFISIKTNIVQGNSVCIIDCEPYIPSGTQIPALLDDEKCYRRTGPRTDEVKQGRPFAKFVAERKGDN
ncbi:ATP-binding protein [Candidatus Thioglobus sp.]|nr:ATP-binding protein [Candidatus Thioglobus sp.]